MSEPSADSATAAAAAALEAAVEAGARASLAACDASHDFGHVDRVRAVATRLAHSEGLAADADTLAVVRLSALLHDVDDHKYGGDEVGLPNARRIMRDAHVAPQLVERVAAVIARIGFSANLGALAAPLPLEAAVVQDADRLDAVGAIGIARCFTYGGAKHRVLHDPAVVPRPPGLSKEEYREGESKTTTINHFYEKLLTLSGGMATRSGAAAAAQRHAFMKSFLDQFLAEWNGVA